MRRRILCVVVLHILSSTPALAEQRTCVFTDFEGAMTEEDAVEWIGQRIDFDLKLCGPSGAVVDSCLDRAHLIRADRKAAGAAIVARAIVAPQFLTVVYQTKNRTVDGLRRLSAEEGVSEAGVKTGSYNGSYRYRVHNNGRCEAILEVDHFVPVRAKGRVVK